MLDRIFAAPISNFLYSIFSIFCLLAEHEIVIQCSKTWGFRGKVSIPKCYYFNQKRQQQMPTDILIYIPKCHYFDFFTESPREYVFTFTFQNVTILIKSFRIMQKHIKEFTFQNVTILISSFHICNVNPEGHLHSKMSLF